MNKSIWRTCALFCSLMIAGSAAWADERPNLNVAVTLNPPRLDPMAENSNVNSRVMKNVLETLIRTDSQNDGALVPGLAESWSRIDGRTVEFKIRPGVTCHNGEDFDASDVAFSLGPIRFMGEDAPGWAIAQQYLGGLEAVDVKDSHTVQIRFKERDPLIELRFANWMTEMVCQDAYEAAGSWESWVQNPVGTGPYKIGEVVHGDYIRLDANDAYWGGAVPANSVTFKIVPEMASRIAGLTTGEYDFITELTVDQFPVLDANEDLTIAGGPIRNIRVIIYDENNPQLQDVRIRQALSHAIDRDLIVDAMFGGRVTVPNGLQMKIFGDLYIADHQGTSYDPEKAKALLKEAGYNGEEISYRYLQDYYTGEVDTAQILAEMWRQVGLNIKLELVENWGQIEDVAEGRGIFNWSNSAEYPDPLGQIYRLYGPNGWFQVNGTYESEEFNALGEALQIGETPERIEAMRAMLEIYERTDPPGTYLHTLPMFYGVRNTINWVPTDTGFMDFSANSLSFSN
ncbi:MAG: ABC transporter substrate-binding protein [Marivita sp.]